MRYILSTIIITLLTQLSAAGQEIDSSEVKKNAFLAAKIMDNALVTKDWYTYVESNHPTVINQVPGGVAGLVKQTMEQVEALEESGNKIIAAWPGQASDIIDTAGEYQLTLPQYMEIRLPNGKLKTQTTLLGISMDKGNKWYFIDLEASGNDINKLKEIFPKVSSRIKVNPPAEPTFTPDK